MEYELLAKNVLHFPKLLESPEDYVSFCKNEASSLGIQIEPWISGGDVNPHIYGDMWILKRSIESDTVQRLMDNYDKATLIACRGFLDYLKVEHKKIDATIEWISGMRPKALTVKSYFEGEFLGAHPDIPLDNTEDVLHITVSTYYNDDYEGGELGIVGGLSVKPTPGSVVVFPSKYLHESTTIPRGIKYVSNEVVRLDPAYVEKL